MGRQNERSGSFLAAFGSFYWGVFGEFCPRASAAPGAAGIAPHGSSVPNDFHVVPRTTGTFGTFWHFFEGSSVPSRRARPIQERAFREMARPMCPYRNSLFSNVLRRRPRPSASHSPARGSGASGRPRSVALAWHYCEGVPSPAPMSWSSARGTPWMAKNGPAGIVSAPTAAWLIHHTMRRLPTRTETRGVDSTELVEVRNAGRRRNTFAQKSALGPKRVFHDRKANPSWELWRLEGLEKSGSFWQLLATFRGSSISCPRVSAAPSSGRCFSPGVAYRAHAA